jgi:hypothetical protein
MSLQVRRRRNRHLIDKEMVESCKNKKAIHPNIRSPRITESWNDEDILPEWGAMFHKPLFKEGFRS